MLNKDKQGIRAIAFQTIGLGNREGTKVSGMTFILAVGFIFTFLLYLFASMLSWWGLNDWTYGNPDILIINPPDSLIEYASVHIPDKPVTYDTYDAVYDYNHILEMMKSKSAGVALVFNEEEHEILTYYRVDSPDYANFRTRFVDGWLETYFMHTIPNYNVQDKYEISEVPIPTESNIPYSLRFAKSMAKTFVPLIIFIGIMYAAMSSGTEAIAGQKERGTFLSIILSPLERSSIVLGFTLGVFVKTLIPALLLSLVVFLPVYFSLAALIGMVLLTSSLAFLIAALTILISIMNNTVTASQTAFLPVFFVLIIVAVTCINESSDVAAFYYYLPVYGQFYGIGSSLNHEAHFLGIIVSSLLTFAIAFGMTYLSTRLISNERFIVSYTSADKKTTNDKLLPKVLSKIIGLFDTIVYPLAVLSIYQLLSMIPVVIAYMKDPDYSSFIANLQGVSTVPEVITKTTQILGIFMNDSRFLALMTIGYFLIIFTYMIRAKGLRGIGLKKEGFIRQYSLGCLWGIGMMSLVFALLCLTGLCKPSSFGISKGSALTFIFSLLMWFPQGASEEVMFRGFMIPRLKTMFNRPIAIIISSLLFSLFHTMNAGFSPLAFVNIFLFAVLFALIYELTESIAFTCAAHTMWNLFQGSIYGLSVSGNATTSLLTSNYTGAAFGPEGTIEATIVIVIALAVVIIGKKFFGRQALKSH